MGFAGIMKDLIDDNYRGPNTGRNYPIINTTIKFTEREKHFFNKYHIDYSEKTNKIKDTVKAIESTKIVQEDKSLTKQILNKWRYVLEYRSNNCYWLKKKMVSSRSKAYLDSYLAETKEACLSVEKILKKYTIIQCINSGVKDDLNSEEDILKNISMEMIARLLEALEEIEKEQYSSEIIKDMKFLVSIVLGKKKEGIYCCTDNEYLNYLKEILKNYDDREECICGNEIRFNKYRFCLCCGKEYK